MERAAQADLPQIYLKPGEIHVSGAPSLVYTVLGSCVAITMHSRRLMAGAICHAMLPEGCASCDGGLRCRREKDRNMLRYVDCAIEHMIEGLAKLGARPGELEARVLGGSSMVANRHDLKIGRLNSKKAYESLEARGVDIVEYAVGGTLGRKVYYNTGTGEVFWNWIRKRPEHVRPFASLAGLKLNEGPTGGEDE